MLARADIDALLAEASVAEAAGQTAAALGALTVATAELLEQGRTYQYPFEWMARLECALGDHAAAERAAAVGRAIAEEAGHKPGVFRMDVLRADLARRALDLPRAAELLAGLRGDGPPLGEPAAERLGEIVAWLRALEFADHPDRSRALPRIEVALAVAELLAEQGKYRSAHSLLAEIEGELDGADLPVRADQVQLLRAELRIAAGELEAAGELLAALPAPAAAGDRTRAAVVRTRAALAGGQLAHATAELDALAEAPAGDPSLFAAAVAARIAVAAELNLLESARQIADAARAALAEAAAPALPPAPALDLIARAARDAAIRGRSAIALWEVPFTPAAAAAPTPSTPPFLGAPAAAPWRLTAAWTGALNGVLLALEQGDLADAAVEQAQLEALAGAIESEDVACRVELSAALIAYYGGGAPIERLLAVADRLRAVGARLAEAQAVRFAAWAAARLGRFGEHAALARRASAIVDAIAGELDPERRACFLMNKWSGRDELVGARIRELLRGPGDRPRRPSRRELRRAFREIDELTHWPIDDVFDDRGASALPADAGPELVATWVRERLAREPARARTSCGIELRSALDLWRFPARTLVLHYHVLPDRTYLFRIARRHLDVSILPVGRVHLGMDMCVAAADPDQLRWLAEYTGVADALARFPGIRRLVIVPHDAMAGVPFAALPVGDRPLCAAVPIAQVDRLARLRRRPRPPRPGPLLSVGCASYGVAGLADLPAAEREADAVLAALGGDGTVQHAATLDSVLAALPGVARLHVAAHGVFDAADPARSGIVLGDGDGGHATLTLRELRRLPLDRLELATLATCRSAQHARLPGRERICLPTALLDAGARGVIASLWPVEDEPSAEIMAALYARLRSEPPAHALAGVQAKLWRRHPARQWAGLVFYGNE